MTGDKLAGKPCLPASIALVRRSARICVVAASKNTSIVAVFQRRIEFGREVDRCRIYAPARRLFPYCGLPEWGRASPGRHWAAPRHLARGSQQSNAPKCWLSPMRPGDAVHHNAEPAGGHARDTPASATAAGIRNASYRHVETTAPRLFTSPKNAGRAGYSCTPVYQPALRGCATVLTRSQQRQQHRRDLFSQLDARRLRLFHHELCSRRYRPRSSAPA